MLVAINPEMPNIHRTKVAGMISCSCGSSGVRHGNLENNARNDGIIACASGNRSSRHSELVNNVRYNSSRIQGDPVDIMSATVKGKP